MRGPPNQISLIGGRVYVGEGGGWSFLIFFKFHDTKGIRGGSGILQLDPRCILFRIGTLHGGGGGVGVSWGGGGALAPKGSPTICH